MLENLAEGSYYGVQGTNWTTRRCWPTRRRRVTIHGRKLLLFKSGSRLRYVAWKRKNAVYWVSNCLTAEPVQRADARHRRAP